MATIGIVILKHQEREDHTWNVRIRVTQDRKVAYMPTPYYIDKSLLDKNGVIKTKNNPIYDQVMIDVIKIRQEIGRLGHRVDVFDAQGLASYMRDFLSGNNKYIDFMAFAQGYIKELVAGGRRISQSYSAMLSRLRQFTGKESLPFRDITPSFLFSFDKWLRMQESRNSTEKKKLYITGSGVRMYMGCISHIFTLARLKYNNEDLGITEIGNPFLKYKSPKANPVRKKALSIDGIRKIRDAEIPASWEGTILARDAFMISFYLCGMNMVDLFYLPKMKGRIEYERHKTAGRREDRAFISIGVQPELKPYLERYDGGDMMFNFHQRYKNDKQFVTKVNGNLKRLGKLIGIDGLKTYAARHSFATIARNDCNVSMDDIAMCLNHKPVQDVTDIYIKKDFTRIDKVLRMVLDKING